MSSSSSSTNLAARRLRTGEPGLGGRRWRIDDNDVQPLVLGSDRFEGRHAFVADAGDDDQVDELGLGENAAGQAAR